MNSNRPPTARSRRPDRGPLRAGTVHPDTAARVVRERTAGLHQRAEAEFRLADRLASVSHYAELLRRIHAFHLEREAQAIGLLGSRREFELPARRRAHLAAADLRALGSALASPASGPERWCPADAEEALGLCYVLEGSVLGGRIVAREVALRLPEAADMTSFFAASLDPTRPTWPTFLAAVNATIVSDDRLDRFTLGAQAAFGAYIGEVLGVPIGPRR